MPDVELWRAVELLMHPIRREIIEKLLLSKGESIADLTKEMNKPWTTIAYHLDVLEQSGILRPSYEKIAHSWGHVYRVESSNLVRLRRKIKRGVDRDLIHDLRK